MATVIFPSSPSVPPKVHHARAMAALWIAIAAIIIGLIYWWAATRYSSTPYFSSDPPPSAKEMEVRRTAASTPATLTAAEVIIKESLLKTSEKPAPTKMTEAQKQSKAQLVQSTQ